MQTKPDTEAPASESSATPNPKRWKNNGTIRNIAAPIYGESDLPRTNGTRYLIPVKQTFENLKAQYSIPALCLFNGAVSYVIFPYLARAVVPLAFATMPFENGRPIADTVLTSVFTPCLGICFSALAAATLGTLRQRQQDIRTQLLQEAILVETLRMPLKKLFNASPHSMMRVQVLLLAYCRMVQCNSSKECSHFPRLDIMELERRCMLALLAVIGEVDLDLCQKEASEAIVYSRVVGYAQSLVNQISSCAAKRASVYLSGFPTVHWVILVLLAVVIPLDFVVLAATSKGTNLELFDDKFLRFVFTVLCLAVSAVSALLLDLNAPFSPNYRVTEGRRFAPISMELEDLIVQLTQESSAHTAQGESELPLDVVNGLLQLAILDPLTVARSPPPPLLDDYVQERTFWL